MYLTESQCSNGLVGITPFSNTSLKFAKIFVYNLTNATAKFDKKLLKKNNLNLMFRHIFRKYVR